MDTTIFKGTVKGHHIELHENCSLPEGTQVIITPVDPDQGSPEAILQAAQAPPHIDLEDVEMLNSLIAEGKKSVRYGDPFQTGEDR